MKNLKISIRPRRIFENLIIIFLTAILFAGISGCGKLATNSQNDTNINQESQATDTEPINQIQPTPTSETQEQDMVTITKDEGGWKTYTNTDWGIRFRYPEEWFFNNCSNVYYFSSFNFVVSKDEHDCNDGGLGQSSLIFIETFKKEIYEKNIIFEREEQSLVNISFEEKHLFFADNKYLQTKRISYAVGGDGELLPGMTKIKYFSTYIPLNEEKVVRLFYFQRFESLEPDFISDSNYYDIYHNLIDSFEVLDVKSSKK